MHETKLAGPVSFWVQSLYRIVSYRLFYRLDVHHVTQPATLRDNLLIDWSHLSQVSVPGKEDNKIGGREELRLAETDTWQLLTETIESGLECIEDWSFIVQCYLGRDKLKILGNNVDI